MFSILKPFLFNLDPETAHDLAIKSLKFDFIPEKFFKVENEEMLETTFLKRKIKNPIGLAAGFDKSAEAYRSLWKLGFGLIEVGTVTPRKQFGNPKPRIFRLEEDEALINRLGFNNDGLEVVVDRLDRSINPPGILGVNIGPNYDSSSYEHDFLKCLYNVMKYALADYVTINISSPNTENLRDFHDEAKLESLMKDINKLKKDPKPTTDMPIFLKKEIGLPEKEIVMKARPVRKGRHVPFAPAPISEVVDTIAAEKPHLVFAPHVETASGIILPQEYMRDLSDAIHKVGGLFVLDCIASGAIWVDMEAVGVDVLISAPQKGWSASPCSALVMLSELAKRTIEGTDSSSFAADLKKWLQIMETYESGSHAYHATMPTDSIQKFHATMKETEAYGFDKIREQQNKLGQRVRKLISKKGFQSLAADGYGAPGVVVAYTDDPDMQNGSKFAAVGMQTAAGVPLMCDEPADFRTFRLGLFGLDKLLNIDRTVEALEKAIESVTGTTNIR